VKIDVLEQAEHEKKDVREENRNVIIIIDSDSNERFVF